MLIVRETIACSIEDVRIEATCAIMLPTKSEIERMLRLPLPIKTQSA